MNKSVIWTAILCIVAGILQSAALGSIALYGAVPDIALCILVFSAYVNGTMTGQVSGFLSGLFLDLFSIAPLGLNCLIRTIIGALTGLFKGTFFLGKIFLPAILCALATIIKAIILFLLHFISGKIIPAYPLLAPVLWIELGMNTIMAPLLFLILHRLPFLRPPQWSNR
jgi:rod shape-determining protein MreD